MPNFHLPRRIEAAYQTDIYDLMRKITPKPISDIDAFINGLAELSQRLDLIEIAAKIAQRMVIGVNVQNVKTWREAAARSQHSRKLYHLLQDELRGGVGILFRQRIFENAQLIRSVPADVAASLSRDIAKGQQMGLTASTMAKAIQQRFPELLASRVKMIARTEGAKTSTALTEARATEIGVDWLTWSTSQDQRVRPSHKAMNGVILSWHDLPSPEALIGEKSSLGRYGPGGVPYCRCVPAVILSADDVTFPRRLYQMGRIRMVSRGEFQRLTNIGDRLAA